MKTIIAIFALWSFTIAAIAKTLTLGIDLSGSNFLLIHANFAQAASQYVSAEIGKLKNGDTVVIKTFGATDDALNLLSHTFTIGRRMKPKRVAKAVAQYLQSLPSQTELAQSSTNLIAWLEFTDGFNCADKSQILVITDGLESSSYVEARDLLEGKKGLPKADVDLTGCFLTFYGLGVGWPPQSKKIVRREWRNWSKQAGATFTAITP